MKPEIKEKWVNALRSGEYLQGKGILKSRSDPATYCCLGVLCDLYVKANNLKWKPCETFFPSDKNYVKCFSIHNEGVILPEKVAQWSGIDLDKYGSMIDLVEITDQETGIPLELVSLTLLNDVKNYTFSQIADVIQEKL